MLQFANMTQVHQLHKLQEIDQEIRDKKNRLTEVLQILKGPGWLLQARQRMETAVSELQTLQNQHNTLNLELQSLRTKIKNSENRLYSGKVTNPKELADLQGEIDSLGRRASNQEDEVLEVMILIEDAEAEKTEADDALVKVEARWETESAALQIEKNDLAMRLNKLLGMRKAQVGAIDAASLTEYDQMAKKKGGVVVARLRGDMCLGCRTTVSANKVKEAREGKKIYCGSCGRIIYPY